MKPSISSMELIGACGLYCGSCRKFRKENAQDAMPMRRQHGVESVNVAIKWVTAPVLDARSRMSILAKRTIISSAASWVFFSTATALPVSATSADMVRRNLPTACR